jgi:gliding motility-associated-like protein
MLKNPYFYFYLILLLLSATVSKAQTACFTPSAVKGCAPFTVTLDASCAVYDASMTTPEYNYDYLNHPLDVAFFTTAKIFTYTTPGTYRILQFIGTIATQYYVDVIVVASPAPIFTLKSCIGRSVDLTITDPIYDKFEINWGDGSPAVTVLSGTTTNHVYASDGNKSVTVTGIFLPNAACATKSQSIYVVQSIVKPDLTQLKVLKQHTTLGQIQLTYNSITGQKYNIERSINGAAYTVINPSPIIGTGIQTYTDAGLNTQSNVYQYRIVAFDDCSASNTSDPIYSIIMKAFASNALNTVSWNGDPTVTQFDLKKNTLSQTLPSPTATSYSDNSIVCGTSYCYNTTATLSTNTLSGAPQISISIDTCIKAISTNIPPAVQNINSTIKGSYATISWIPAGTGITYKLYQSVNGGSYSLLSKVTGSTYSYPLPDLNATYCYQLDYSDLCGNNSPTSTSTCPSILQGTLTGTSITINWSSYSGFNNTGVQSYIVQKLDQNNVVLSEINVGQATTYSETVNLTDPFVNYQIKVIPTDPTYTPSYSNNSLFKFEAEIFAPDIFTPNEDHSNDYFIVKGRFIKSYSISIFSRWGEVVYISTDITVGWNGFNQLVYAPEGVYTYKIIASDVNNKEFTKTGTITLAR